MIQRDRMLALIAANPGRNPQQLARLARLSVKSASAVCAMLFAAQRVDRNRSDRTFIYYVKGSAPAPRPAFPLPTVAEGRAAFDRATAGTPHQPGALEVAWRSFIALRNGPREEFRRAFENYMAIAWSDR